MLDMILESSNLRPTRPIASRATRSRTVSNSTGGRPKLGLDRASTGPVFWNEDVSVSKLSIC
jgi:hypothetical protein